MELPVWLVKNNSSAHTSLNRRQPQDPGVLRPAPFFLLSTEVTRKVEPSSCHSEDTSHKLQLGEKAEGR